MRSVDEYIAGLPEDLAEICARLREIILATVPEATEKISFKIPFYHYHGMFCYLNRVKDGIDVGFLRGRDLLDIFPQLQQGNRKIVASVIVRNKADIRTLELPEIIAAAAGWNREAFLAKKSFLTVSRDRKKPATSSGKKSARGRR
jgi:hypothetical protein